MRYTKKKDETGFFSNMKTVLLLMNLAGKRNRLFRTGGSHPLLFSYFQDRQNGNTAS